MAGRTTIARTWLAQAEADLLAARDSAATGHFEWSCFQAQQAAGKVLEAFLYARGRTSIVTHSVRRLLRACAGEESGFDRLDEAARLLDQHYIPTRYPNGLDLKIEPARHYDAKDAERCLESARSILERVKQSWRS